MTMKKARISHRLLLALAVISSAFNSRLARAQDSATGVVKPGGIGLPRELPRGTGRNGLYDAVNMQETLPLDVPRLLEEDARREGGPTRAGVVQDVDVSSDTAGRWVQ